MRKLILVLAVAGVVLAGSVAAAETPAVSIELAHNSANEQQVKDQLERLLKEYDMSRWICPCSTFWPSFTFSRFSRAP
jgi:hypothetical protein